MSRIVVGVDGSDESRAALRWAADEARLRDAMLEVVYVYDYRPAYELYEYPAGLASEGWAETDRERTAQHARALAESMAGEVEASTGIGVAAFPIEDRRPARALVDHAEDADLLVVGSRGRGGFAGLLLGSVSQQCVQHAICPVTVVPSG